ncbi:glycosyltransferase [Candidatus Berkelbacteria bacterium]|nr:glycosyltransferase [Candidatus Berkelbacteria bacterium]
MHIALVTEAFLPLKNGVVNAVLLIHDELKRQGHQVSIIAPATPGVRVRLRGLHSVPALPLPGRSGYSLSFPHLSQLHKLLARAHIIHTHHPFTLGHWALKIAKRAHRPLIFTNHTQYMNYTHHVPVIGSILKEPLAKYVTEFINQCTVVVAPALSTLKALKADGITAPIQHVPNGIDVGHFATGDVLYLSKRLALKIDTPILLYSGRLSEEKNLEFLIRTIAALPEHPHLALVGDGPQRAELEILAHTLKASERIHFLGAMPYEKMPHVYAGATFFVTASKSEVHPLTVLEAFAAGLPAVVFDARGTADIVEDHRTGIVSRPTHTAFSAGIRQLLHRPALREQYGKMAQAVAKKQYSVKATTQRLLDTYRLAIRLAHIDD